MSFIPPPLTRERLALIIRALDRRGGTMKARDLARFSSVEWWEIDQAEELEFVTTEERKPKTGRPSKWVILNGRPTATYPYWAPKSGIDRKNVSKTNPTKLPSRFQQDRRISRKEWNFAFWYVIGDFGEGQGPFGFKRRAWSAYLKAYPSCRSKAAARSSSSRLLKRPRVKAAIAWEFAKMDRLLNISRFYPSTATEIWDILHRLGSERARWAPPDIRQRWIVAGLQAKQKPNGIT